MAENEWLSGYLDAIIDQGETVDELARSSRKVEIDLSDMSGQSATAIRYFVNEVTGFSEAHLHRTWMKATAIKNIHDRGARLENFCWRIWHLSRKKKQIEIEELERREARKQEKAAVQGDLREDLLEFGGDEEVHDQEENIQEQEEEEESKEGERLPAYAGGFRMEKEHEMGAESKQISRRLYIVMISLHGLVRGENMELGKDSDTGGQVKYVVELARALATMPQVYRVDLLTRQITAPNVDWSYAEPVEMLSSGKYEMESAGESAGAFIVRIPCGPHDKYIQKELLWPYVPEFVDGALAHVVHMSKVLSEQVGNGKRVWPYVIHGHYADAGDVAALLSGALNVPMVLTGHSLGRNKLEQLLKQGRSSFQEVNTTYKILRRTEAEEFALDAAELVVTSTRQEIEQQWGLYDGFDVRLENVLRLRQKREVSCHGRYMPRMAVIAPGMDFSHVVVPTVDSPPGDSGSPEAPIWNEIRRFFSNPHKPMILALARPDPKKNLTKLVRAFGESKALRDLANLTLIMGNRDDIDAMGVANSEVLTTVLKLVDKYDMYGQVAYPKHHQQHEVPEIYALAARSKGVFVNPALVEPFGLTLIEAAAHGLPMVATKNGGPVDIQKTLENGLLIDPHDEAGMAEALFSLVSDRSRWSECQKNALENIHKYSWLEHCRRYLARITRCRLRHPQWRAEALFNAISISADDVGGVGSMNSDSLRDIRDLSMGLSVDGKYFNIGDSVDFGKLQGREDIMDNAAKDAKRAGVCASMGEGLLLSKSERAAAAGSGPLSFFESLENNRTSSVNSEAGLGATSPSSTSHRMRLRQLKKLIVVAVDDYDDRGRPVAAQNKFVEVLKAVLSSVKGSSKSKSGAVGVGIATALSGHEVVELLVREGIGLAGIDIVIAASGSELFYSVPTMPEGAMSELEDGQGLQLVFDPDYFSHIEYRWSAEGLKKSMLRAVASPVDLVNGNLRIAESALVEDHRLSSSRCLCFQVKDANKMPKAEEIRKRLRMRGLRSHVIFCRRASYFYALPLHASRAQALRYLFVRWDINVADIAVVVGEEGDGDYHQLLSGTHHTIILPDDNPSPAPPVQKTLLSFPHVDSLSHLPNVFKMNQAHTSMEDLSKTLKRIHSLS